LLGEGVMPRGLSIIFGAALIAFGVMSFYDYLVIDPLWLRITIIVIGGLSFIFGIFGRNRR
jgi:uncharacterized membrane protein